MPGRANSIKKAIRLVLIFVTMLLLTITIQECAKPRKMEHGFTVFPPLLEKQEGRANRKSEERSDLNFCNGRAVGHTERAVLEISVVARGGDLTSIRKEDGAVS